MTGSIFGIKDPVAEVGVWLAEAAGTEPNDPNAMALSTVDADGMPNVRIVLLKEIEPDGFVFYTNYHSAKGDEIAAAGKAAFVLHWKSRRRQVRVRGRTERVSAAQSDAYYDTRALDSRLGAWASRQSRPLADRETLEAEVEAARAAQGDAPQRPPHWGGVRIVPQSIEFWSDGAHRLHDREQWNRLKEGWTCRRLYP